MQQRKYLDDEDHGRGYVEIPSISQELTSIVVIIIPEPDSYKHTVSIFAKQIDAANNSAFK